MLRLTISASNVQRLRPNKIKKPSSNNTLSRRFQSEGNPQVQRDFGNSNSNNHSNNNRRPAAPNPNNVRRPNYVQTMRVQPKNPNNNQGNAQSPQGQKGQVPPRKKAYTSSKLEDLLRTGGPKPTGSSQPPSGLQQAFRSPNSKQMSASQSNLQGSSLNNNKGAGGNSNKMTPNLVDFFQQRLAEANTKNVGEGVGFPGSNANTKNNNANNNTIKPLRFREAIGSPRPAQQQQRGPQTPTNVRRLQQQMNNNNNTGSLNAAKNQARLAQQGSTANGSQQSQRQQQQQNIKTPPLGGSIDEHLSSSLSSVNIATNSSSSSNKESTTETKVESKSPIHQFILEIQKKTKQQKLEEAAKQKTMEDARDIPSWRKSAQRLKENQSVDPLFSTSQIIQDNSAEEVPLDPYQLHMAGQQPSPKQSHRRAKPKTIVLPSHPITIKELSPLFGKKVDRIMRTLRNLGETPINDDSYTIDVEIVEMIAMEMHLRFERPKRRRKVEISDHQQLMERRKAVEENTGDSLDTNDAGADTEIEHKSYDQLARRPPVVCIMGHVDHGKTTLMDSLRRLAQSGAIKQKKVKKSKKGGKKAKPVKGCGDMAGTEAGGITQVISAFQVPLGEQNDSLTFLDTPGHAAFSAMRQSGSHAADVIVLVVAADDGVSPQTVEILEFYKSIVKDSDGGITMVVAMNKIDKPGIDVEESKRRIENELLEHGIIPEGVASDSEYGEPVQVFPISAKTGEGVDDLVEGLALQSEIMDLRADDTARAEGIVMDARVEQGLGVVVDCIVRWGSLNHGDVVVSGTSYGKVRILKDVDDKSVKIGTPSQPVRVVGFKTPPKAGDPIVCVASEQVAEELVSRRLAKQEREKSIEGSANPDSIANFSQIIITGRESMTAAGTEKKLGRYDLNLEDTGPIRIPVVVKAKADGSVAAVRDSLVMLGKESSFDLNVDVVAEGVGPLTRTDIEMAKASNAAVFCFDVKNNDRGVLAMAEEEEVVIHEFNVIYSLLDEAKELFTEYLPPVAVETLHGKATVQAIYNISGGKEIIAGMRVLEGHMYKATVEGDKATPVHFRVIRKGKRVSSEGETVTSVSLKRFKDDVESVRQGDECGLSLTGVTDYEEGDVVECYSVKMTRSFA